MTPQSGSWNVVGISSTSDWDISNSTSSSTYGGNACDFLVADGHQGTISPTTGTLVRFSGSASATAMHAGLTSMTAGTQASFSWTSSIILRMVEVNVAASGNHVITVNGSSTLGWAWYQPNGGASWRSRSQASFTGTAGGGSVTQNLTSAGYHALVIFRDGGSGTSTTVTVSVVPQTTTLALSQGAAATVSSTPTNFSLTPQSSFWNVVGVSSTSDWDIANASSSSALGGNSCDFLVADGNQGSIAPTTGTVTRFSGSASAVAMHAGLTTVTVGTQASYGWGSSAILRAFEVYVPSTGIHSISVGGSSSLGWAWFQPNGSASWRSRGSAAFSGVAGGGSITQNLTVAGYHALVVFRDGGAGTSTTVTVDVTVPTPAITLVQGAPQTVSATPTNFSFTPQSNYWNVVGISSPSDWDISNSATTSAQGGAACDFLVADGNQGTIAPNTGNVIRFSGTASATAMQAGLTSVSVGTQASFGWGSNAILRIFEVNVPATGSYNLNVGGSSTLGWAWFQPSGSASWRSRNQAAFSGTVGAGGTSLNLSSTGYHALVVFRDGGPGTSATVTVDVTVPTPAITLVQGAPQTVSATPTNFSFTPQSVYWNAVGISSPSDWDIFNSATGSAQGGAACDFLVADGNQGTISPNTGNFIRFSGTASATAMHAGLTSVSVGTQASFGWGSNAILRIFEVNVTSTGTYNLNVGGSSTLGWAWFQPSGSASWRRRNQAAFSGTVGAGTTGLNLSSNGYHALVVFRDGGPGTSATVTVDVTPVPACVTPSIASISPSATVAGCPGFSLTVNGAGFVPGSVIRWNGTPLSTNYLSGSQLSAQVTASQIAAQGTASIEVFTAPNCLSNVQTLTIGSPVASNSLGVPYGNALLGGFLGAYGATQSSPSSALAFGEVTGWVRVFGSPYIEAASVYGLAQRTNASGSGFVVMEIGNIIVFVQQFSTSVTVNPPAWMLPSGSAVVLPPTPYSVGPVPVWVRADVGAGTDVNLSAAIGLPPSVGLTGTGRGWAWGSVCASLVLPAAAGPCQTSAANTAAGIFAVVNFADTTLTYNLNANQCGFSNSLSLCVQPIALQLDLFATYFGIPYSLNLVSWNWPAQPICYTIL